MLARPENLVQRPDARRRARRLTLAAALLLAAGAARAAAPCASARAAEAREDLVAALAPYGEWVEVARHGRAWRPCGVEEGWRPYYHGSWTWTEDGWFWVTDEPWGWAAYHYGRWLFDGAYGWVWVPGREWAPAWVAWRWDRAVVGWAPLPPDGRPLAAFWTFVPASRFVGERVEAMALPAARTPALLVRTRAASRGAALVRDDRPQNAPAFTVHMPR